MPATYTPAFPLKAAWKSVLSQDVITTNTIPVDSTSASPIAVFTNPAGGGEPGNPLPEALAIVNTGKGRQLCHVARDPEADAGWRARPLLDGRAVDEVAACLVNAGSSEATIHGIFLQDNAMHSISLGADGVTWEPPRPVSGPSIAKPRIAYSPLGNRAVVYGADLAGDLIVAYQNQTGGPFASRRCKTGGLLAGGDFQLCMTSDQDFRILANVNGEARLLTGVLNGDTVSSSGPAPGLTGKVKQIALGYWSSVKSTVIFLIVGEDSALHSWSQGQAQSGRAQQIPNSSVSQAVGHVAEDRSLHVYAVDSSNRLWVLHQSPQRPWKDDGTPNWMPFLPLDQGVARLASDMHPSASPALFALDGGDFSLRLHEMDAGSRLWQSRTLLQPAARGFEVTRFRTEINLVDKRGVPLSNHKVTLSVDDGSSAVEVWAGGKVRTVDHDGVEVASDATGKLTLAILTNAGLACPTLRLTGDGLDPVEIEPAGETHLYLSGKGALHPTRPGGALPVFDESGNALGSAKVDGKPLAPAAGDSAIAKVAAAAIRGGAMVGTNTAPADFHGFAASLDRQAPRFHSFHSPQELHAFRSRLGLANVELSAGLGPFWGDIFEGIKNGLIAIKDFIVDVAGKVVQLAVRIGEWISDTFTLALDSPEKAAHFIAGIFEFVGAQIHKVIDWLKALFDFKAIWHTKMALEQAIVSVPRYIGGLAKTGRKGADKWFAKQQAELDAYFDKTIANYTGKKFSELDGWQPTDGSGGSTPIAGGATSSDFNANPHHNWLQDKVSAYAPADSGVPESPDNAWDDFATHMGHAGKRFESALENFKETLLVVIKDPSLFATYGIAHLLGAVKDLIGGMLDACAGMVDFFAGLIESAMQAFESLLTAALPVPLLDTLWKWMAEQAGYPEDGKLTMCSLISLFAAFPTTIIYKLIKGVDHEPFPTGKLPLQHVSRGGLLGVTMPKVCREISCILIMIRCIPANIQDALNELSPWWMTVIGVGFSVAIWVLANGYPEWGALGWIAASAIAANMLWILPAAYFILELENAVLHKSIMDNRGDISSVAFTILGVATLAFGIVQDATDEKVTPGQAVSNVVSPLSSLFAFLNLRAIRDSPYGPAALAAKLIFNLVAYIIGGGALLASVVVDDTAAVA